MTPELIELSKRAVACKGWRWMEGMLTLDSDRILRVDDDGYKFAWRKYNFAYSPPADALPDLEDPATLGCLLALVREAWGDECICTLPVDYGPGGVTWFCRLTAGGRDLAQSYVRGGFGEVEALVAALEAAP